MSKNSSNHSRTMSNSIRCTVSDLNIQFMNNNTDNTREENRRKRTLPEIRNAIFTRNGILRDRTAEYTHPLRLDEFNALIMSMPNQNTCSEHTKMMQCNTGTVFDALNRNENVQRRQLNALEYERECQPRPVVDALAMDDDESWYTNEIENNFAYNNSIHDMTDREYERVRSKTIHTVLQQYDNVFIPQPYTEWLRSDTRTLQMRKVIQQHIKHGLNDVCNFTQLTEIVSDLVMYTAVMTPWIDYTKPYVIRIAADILDTFRNMNYDQLRMAVDRHINDTDRVYAQRKAQLYSPTKLP